MPVDGRCDNDGVSSSAPVAAAGQLPRTWGFARIGLVLLWVLAAGLSWWTSPQEESYDQAGKDLAAGRVAAYQWGDRWDDQNQQRWFGSPELTSSGSTLGPLFVWRTTDGRVHWVDAERFDEVDAVNDGRWSGPGAAALGREVEARGAGSQELTVGWVSAAVAWSGVALGLTFLGVVIWGPAPARGTRWFWFWVGALVPFGLGLLFWLARDRPWARSAVPDGRSRDGGLAGFAIGFLSSIFLGFVLIGLHELFGEFWVPL
jgi:hypothetical protein